MGAYSRVDAYKLLGLSGWAVIRINTVFLYVGLDSILGHRISNS